MTVRGRCLVTGGGGYLGRALCLALARRGTAVVSYDLRPTGAAHPNVHEVPGDVCDRERLVAAMQGVDCVFHTASIIDLATGLAGVRRLVYTSSNMVVFDGRPARRLTEDAPYPGRPLAPYTATKAQAERAVLAADGPALATCAIRPSGIWGPGEQHHLPRVIDEALRGRFPVVIGDGRALTEWSYVDNVVHGHLLAADRLLDPVSPARGRAYFVNDGWYADTVELFRLLFEGCGLRFPRRHVPAWPVVQAMRAWEWLHRMGAPAPMLTRLELLQMVVPHPCSIDRARRDLGYRPLVGIDEAVERTIPYCRELVRTGTATTTPGAPARSPEPAIAA
jgi:3beta-hydroxy-delta5-steroid dehydrogenase/steroid delta-isomerase